AHQCSDACINSSTEWRKVDLAECLFGHIGSVVVTTTFRCAVRHPVFRTRQHFALSAVVATLETKHSRTCERRTQVRIFTRPFCDSSPTRIPRNVDHRCK